MLLIHGKINCMKIITKVLSTIFLVALPIAVIFFMFVTAGACGLGPNACPNIQPLFWSGLAIFILSLPSAFFISLKSNKSNSETIIASVLYVLPLLISGILFLVII